MTKGRGESSVNCDRVGRVNVFCSNEHDERHDNKVQLFRTSEKKKRADDDYSSLGDGRIAGGFLENRRNRYVEGTIPSGSFHSSTLV